METILDRLKNYFDNTSMNQVKKDWEKTEEYDKIDSPPIDAFISESK